MELSEIITERTNLEIKAVGRTYELRNFTLEDEIWLKNEYGEDIGKYLNPDALDVGVLCRICYRLIITKDDFTAREVEIVTEDGEVKREKLGGKKLLARMITNEQDKSALVLAVLTVFANSRPPAVESVEVEKKK